MRRYLLSALAVLCLSPLLFGRPETIDETLVRVRGLYPALVTGDQAAAILNEVAYWHRSEGWALLGKTSGTNCPQPRTGAAISCDYLIQQRGGVWYGIDALIATGKPGTPGKATPNTPVVANADMTALIQSGARSVVEAVGDGSLPPPEQSCPPAPPCPTCPPAPTCPPDQRAMVEVLEEKVSQQEQEIARLTDEQAKLQQQLANVKCETANSFWRSLGINCRVIR